MTKTEWNYKQLKRFVEMLFPFMAKAPERLILRTRHEDDPAQKLMLQDLGKWLKDKHTQFEPDLVPTFGPGRKDFHDRRIVFFPDEKNPRKRITVLMTGGIDRYLDPKFECSVVTQFAV